MRISSRTGNIDAIISRVQSNSTLHRGVADNAINNDWTGTNSSYITDDASCTTPHGTSLHQTIAHPCGNAGTGFHWIPTDNFQMEIYQI